MHVATFEVALLRSRPTRIWPKQDKKKQQQLVPRRAPSMTGMPPLPTRRKIVLFAPWATGCLSSVGQVLFMAPSPSLARVGRRKRQRMCFKEEHRYTQPCEVSYRVLMRVLMRRCKTVTSWVSSAFFKTHPVPRMELRLLFVTSLVKKKPHLYLVWYITDMHNY